LPQGWNLWKGSWQTGVFLKTFSLPQTAGPALRRSSAFRSADRGRRVHAAPEAFFRNNTASTLALLEAMLAHGPRRLVFSSTAAVYGEPETVPIKEDARLQPTNAYGESKLLAEHMIGWMQRVHGLRSQH